MRNKLLLSFIVCASLSPHAQTLQEFIASAREHSPLLKDYANQSANQQDELQRLRTTLTRSRLELTGDYLFVPVVSKDGGGTTFKWSAQDGTDYYGYDLGESSGHLHAGLTWTQPLLGRSHYRVAAEQTRIATEQLAVSSKMEVHQLERSVTEHYLLCLADRAEIAYADSVQSLLAQQRSVVERLARNALARQSDLRLLDIEQEAARQLRTAAAQSYHTHLLDLLLLCGGVSWGGGLQTADKGVATLRRGRATVDSLRATEDKGVATKEPLRGLQPTLAPSTTSSQFVASYHLDSLSAVAALRSFKLQYRPRLDLFVTGGLQTGSFASWQKHFGWSAGLTFAWTLYDGHGLRHRTVQTQRQLATISAYRDDMDRQRRLRLAQCRSEINRYAEQAAAVQRQIADYDQVLQDYEREIRAAQRSVLDYITVLRNRLQAHRTLVALQTNRQLAIAAYNYWNW